MCRCDIEERGNVLEGENREYILVFFNEFVVSLLCRFYMQIHVAGVSGVEQGYAAFCNFLIKIRIGLQSFCQESCRHAVDVARRYCDNRNPRFLAVKRKGKVCNKLIVKLQAYNMLRTVGRICNVFQRARLYIADIPRYFALCHKEFVFLIVAQHAFFETQSSPKVVVDIVVVCIEIGSIQCCLKINSDRAECRHSRLR